MVGKTQLQIEMRAVLTLVELVRLRGEIITLVRLRGGK